MTSGTGKFSSKFLAPKHPKYQSRKAFQFTIEFKLSKQCRLHFGQELAIKMANKPKFESGIRSEVELKRALKYARFADHAILRDIWTNFYMVSKDVYRSNHPTPKQLNRIKDMGVKSILSLRSEDFYGSQTERYVCDQLGLRLEFCPMTASRAPTVSELQNLLEAFDTLPRPFLIHCKSGADRSGLAAALYQIDHDGIDPKIAKKKMLSLRFIHFGFNKKGILRAFIDAYDTARQETGITLRDWISTKYDPENLQRDFDQA